MLMLPRLVQGNEQVSHVWKAVLFMEPLRGLFLGPVGTGPSPDEV